MKLLLLCTAPDTDFLERFQRLAPLRGHQVVKTTTAYTNPVTLDRICDKHEIDAVICCQSGALEAILRDTPDFTVPDRKKLTLDDYAGSLLRLRSGREVVVLNPLERLRTVPFETRVVERYLAKLTDKAKWWPQTEFKWKLVTHENQAEVRERLLAAKLMAIDIEVPWPATAIRELDMCSYTIYDKATHTTESYVVDFTELWHWEFIRDMNDSPAQKIFQNGLFDNSYFMRWGCPVRNWTLDTYHLFHAWLSELPKRLDFVTSFVLRNVRFWKDEGSTGNRVDKHRYNARDGWATMNACLALMELMPDWAISNYTDHEFPMVFPCLHAAMEGLDCDTARFDKIAAEKEQQVSDLRGRVQLLVASPNYNPGSWQQNAELFKVLGCGHLDGTGKIPTLKAKALHPLNNAILSLVEEYKQEAKQVGTYFDSTKLWFSRIYYTLNPGATDTLRVGSTESAFDCGWQIQNIPSKDDAFKQCVLAPEGWFIAEIDKKQSEARCVAYLSGDEALLKLVESPHDYHAWNAAAFFGVPYPEIYDEATGKPLDKPLRDLSKRTNHGANYNMGALVMLDTMGPLFVAKAKMILKLPSKFTLKQTCQYLLDRYNATYPSVKGRWYESIVQAIETSNKLVSPFGWVRWFHGRPRDYKPHLNSAVAHAPQNLSVAIVNKEWYKIWRETVYGSLRGRVRIKAQIHDSLLFIYRAVEDALKVKELMNLRVNVKGSDDVTRELFIPCDLSIGDKPTRRWSEIK